MKILYTGSFNPFHNGHQYVYDVACKCFGRDNVWIGIGKNRSKPDINAERLAYSIHPITRNVITYDGLTADVLKQHNFELIVRGIRPGRSLDDENDLLYWNRKLSGGIETILIPTPPEVNQISSGAIREMEYYKQDVTEYLNSFVYNRWVTPIAARTVYFGQCCSGKSTYLKNPSVRRIDEIFWEYVDVNVANILKDTYKDIFYNNTDAFKSSVHTLGNLIDWDRLFSNAVNIDFPNIGTYWHAIPSRILYGCKLVKIRTSMENRQYFSQQRGANPKLIEMSDKCYIDPPFWDEDIVIEREYI